MCKSLSQEDHSEGYESVANGGISHAEGYGCVSSGMFSHAEGRGCEAKGHTSHAEGALTIASGSRQHVQGQCNIEDTEDKYYDIIGNGYDTDHRSNASAIDKVGNQYLAGNLYVGTTDWANPATDAAHKVATEKFVTDLFNTLVNGDEVSY